MEWPGIQIRQAIASNLIDKYLKFNFITTKGNKNCNASTREQTQ